MTRIEIKTGLLILIIADMVGEGKEPTQAELEALMSKSVGELRKIAGFVPAQKKTEVEL